MDGCALACMVRFFEFSPKLIVKKVTAYSQAGALLYARIGRFLLNDAQMFFNLIKDGQGAHYL
jgi:hypothetical protein